MGHTRNDGRGRGGSLPAKLPRAARKGQQVGKNGRREGGN